MKASKAKVKNDRLLPIDRTPVLQRVIALTAQTRDLGAHRMRAWAPLIKEGQAVLTAHAWVGVRGMPARGGNPTLSQEDFAKAVVYMANASGGKWKDPDAKLMAAIKAEEKKRIAELKTKK